MSLLKLRYLYYLAYSLLYIWIRAREKKKEEDQKKCTWDGLYPIIDSDGYLTGEITDCDDGNEYEIRAEKKRRNQDENRET